MAKIKYGNVEIPADEFKDENMTAHISIRLPMTLLKELRKLALNEKYAGKYQVLIKDILSKWVEENKPSAEMALLKAIFGDDAPKLVRHRAAGKKTTAAPTPHMKYSRRKGATR